MSHVNQTVESLPQYLRRYVAHQRQDHYTPRDHAAWRYILRQSREYFRNTAVSIYLEGLEKTGITIDRIPRIDDMDRKLRELGWGAVPVCGFIPPAAFLDFQARKILPIAADMRTVEHIHYTPAPDIVHEAAGHAPIIADPAYANYLTKYANMAQKALFAKEDLEVYEAIRTLSDVKENPDSTSTLIEYAEERLAQAQGAVEFVSEANKTARMNWWTVEYGLLGSLRNPKIYGAGLLSSVGESQNCLSDKVPKHVLTSACVKTSYDITEPQPQLFVAESVAHLCDVLDDFDRTLAYRRGGLYGLEQAVKGRTVNTLLLDSGLSISGRVTDFLDDRSGEEEVIDFFKFEGPCQLCVGHSQLAGHGTTHHPEGFSTPLGRFLDAPEKDPSRLADDELKKLGLIVGQRRVLRFCSEFKVDGEILRFVRSKERLVMIVWRDCRVTRGAEVFFQPEWGTFDMAVGQSIASVFAGPADRDAYGRHDVGTAATSPARTSPYTESELLMFRTYENLHGLRKKGKGSGFQSSAMLAATRSLLADVNRQFPTEWLLLLETYELGRRVFGDSAEEGLQTIRERLTDCANGGDRTSRWIIEQGLEIVDVAD